MGRPDVKLWPYQAEAFASVFREFDSGKRSTLLVMATGTGKTFTFGTVIRSVNEDHGKQALVLAHRDELIRQADESLATLGVETAIEKADERARGFLFGEAPCVVASVQTLRGKRLKEWPRDQFKLIVVDEAHHAAAVGYRAILDHFRPDWLLGVTATPDRLDGENLGQVFQSVAYEYPLFRAIQEGFLCRLKIIRCETGIDLSKIRTTGGDLNQAEIEEAIRPHVQDLANVARKEIGTRRCILFAPDVGSGQAFASALTSIGVPAMAIHGDSPDRSSILEDFRHGTFRVLCNCALLTEGYDAPFVSAVILARPTKSRAFYSQCVGRGTRKHPGKADCLIVDFGWITGQHELVRPTELFDTTDTSSEVLELADQLLDSGETDDLLKAIEMAEGKVRERRVIRITAREKDVRYRRVYYDPLAVMDTLDLPNRPESPASYRLKASEKQVQLLEKFGVKHADGLSKRRASLMLDKIFERTKRGLATVKQVSLLISRGCDPDAARGMTKGEASAYLDSIGCRSYQRMSTGGK
jgi:superfamily II DNA or RNA helicase